jgi:hypothetical protein
MKNFRSGNIHARGMAKAYDAGRQHVRKLNEDRRRFDFMVQLLNAWCYGEIDLTASEGWFVTQFITEADEDTPKILPEAAAICDELRLKHEKTLIHQDVLSKYGARACGPQQRPNLKTRHLFKTCSQNSIFEDWRREE